MYKRILYTIIITCMITSCETMGSVKRGLTGEKQTSTDEFLVKKKDPLILPPDYKSLPTPADSTSASEEISSFEKALGTSIEDNSESSSSTEDSILKKIKNK